jgi:uncharacterized membrane protein YdjX (TVP38/TMEM64 family)
MKNIKNFFKKNKNILKYVLKFLSMLVFLYIFYKLYKKGVLTDGDKMEAYLGKRAYLAPLIFIILKLVISFVPFIPNTIFIIVGYGVFGRSMGFLLNYIASLIAAIINFLIVKINGSKVINKVFAEDKIKKYYSKVNLSQKKFNKFLLLVNIIPFAPSNFFGMVAALTSITFRKYLEISMIGKVFEVGIIGFAMKYLNNIFNFVK